MDIIKKSYPLEWPVAYPRTVASQRSNFSQKTVDKCTQEIIRQLNLMGARTIVISTNIPLRKDGLPYSDYGRRSIYDKGVAVYFIFKGKQSVLPCDKWDTIEDNMWAIALTIEALRKPEHWGVPQILDRSFTGFAELPMIATAIDYWSILDISPTKNKQTIQDRYIHLAKQYAQDESKLRDLNVARELAIKQCDE